MDRSSKEENYYKQYEQQWNKKLLTMFNCDLFICFAGQLLSVHLDNVLENRKNVEVWLQHSSIPTKQEVAVVANLVIVIENKVDGLEERLFSLVMESCNSKQLLKNVKFEFQQVKRLLEEEVVWKSTNQNIECLKEELEELIANL